MPSSQPDNVLRRFFSGIAENTFQTQLGVVDPPLVDYISDLLVRFLRQDALDKIRNLTGHRVRDLSGMLAEAKSRVGEARRAVHRHIGDYTLFWAGLYPEALRRHKGTVARDQFIDYCEHGKRAYLIASSIEVASDDDTSSDVLERLGYQFEMCAYGLREVRRELEHADDDDLPRPFLIN